MRVLKVKELGTNIREICVQLLDSVLAPKSAAYVSGPLDTGRLFYESLVEGNPSREIIRKLNQERLTRFAEDLRRRLPHPVIDPGPLRVFCWSAQDYGIFFLDVIDRYVKEVWFIDGWEFSHGATKEFGYCVRRDILCLDEKGVTLSFDVGRKLIEQAVSHLERLGVDSSKLRGRIL